MQHEDRSGKPHLTAGISPQYVDSMGLIDDQRWRYASTVGQCRARLGAGICGGHLIPRQPYTIGRVTWYETECSECEAITAAPGGRVLPVSAAAGEQPKTEMARRREQWQRLHDLAKGEAA